MLEAILNLMKTYPVPLSTTFLSQQLQINDGALEGMLQTLERKGRIREVEGERGACATCPIADSCSPTTTKYYALTTTDAAPGSR